MISDLSRRGFLGRSAGVLLAAGMLPGKVFAQEASGENGDFEFIAANDLHFADPKLCPPWFEKVFAAMRQSAPKAEFALISGDLSTTGSAAEFGGMKDLLPLLKMPVHVTLGNHDVTSKGDRTLFEQFFPDQTNYSFEHRGWQILSVNSVESRHAENTKIPEETLKWVENSLKKLDRNKPTILSTHYPLGYGIVRRPKNASNLLDSFQNFNVQGVFNGHYHGFIQTLFKDAIVSTNRCCSRSRSNYDHSPLKGWYVCQARQGLLTRRFVAAPAGLA
jgi:hypothetical protein